MTSDSLPLTPQQDQVLTLLATGSTISDAAEQAGIHRNTIANWRKSSLAFRREFEALHHERALHWRDALQAVGPLAIETIRYAMANTNTPPSVRVRAALAIIDKLTTLPPAEPDLDPAPAQPADPTRETHDPPSPSGKPQDPASSHPGPQLVPDRPAASRPHPRVVQHPKSQNMHKSAQSRRATRTATGKRRPMKAG